MTTAQEAALRLYAHAKQAGKVHTHQQEAGPRKGDSHRGRTASEIATVRRSADGTRLHVRTGKGQGGQNGRTVIVGTRKFSSVRKAREVLGIGASKLYDWLDSGKARYGN